MRSFTLEDASSMARHANDARVAANLRDRFPHPYAFEDALRYLGYVTAERPEVNFAIEVGGEAVGGIGFVLHDDIERVSAEIGYWLGVAVWGRGIATAAVREVTRYAMQTHQLTRVFALPFSSNQGSIRVLQKAGFVREGTLRRATVKAGEIKDQELYAFYDDSPATKRWR